MLLPLNSYLLFKDMPSVFRAYIFYNLGVIVSLFKRLQNYPYKMRDRTLNSGKVGAKLSEIMALLVSQEDHLRSCHSPMSPLQLSSLGPYFLSLLFSFSRHVSALPRLLSSPSLPAFSCLSSFSFSSFSSPLCSSSPSSSYSSPSPCLSLPPALLPAILSALFKMSQWVRMNKEETWPSVGE